MKVLLASTAVFFVFIGLIVLNTRGRGISGAVVLKDFWTYEANNRSFRAGEGVLYLTNQNGSTLTVRLPPRRMAYKVNNVVVEADVPQEFLQNKYIQILPGQTRALKFTYAHALSGDCYMIIELDINGELERLMILLPQIERGKGEIHD